MPKKSPPAKKSSAPKKTSTKKNSKTKTTPEQTPPVTPPVTEPVQPVEVKPTATAVTEQLFSDLQAELTKLAEAGVQIPSLRKGLIALRKSVDKERKELAKAQPKKKRVRTNNENKAPSGFAKPSPISTELAHFLGEKKDALVARTAVTRQINQYVKQHNLQNPDNKRHILPDTKLKKLLGVTDKDEVTYFNLQKYLKKHYPTEKV